MRDKVKRFISILMTALMLVNLMPVGALAEGFTISNSVQSKGALTADSGTAPIETGHVYVYVKIDGASPETLAKFKLNSSGWYTIGSIAKTMPGKAEWKNTGPYYWPNWKWVITPTPSDTKTYQPGADTGAGLLPEYSTDGLVPWEENKLIPLGNVNWTGYKLTTGANNYQPESIASWHMDGIVNFKDINVPYTVKHVVQNSSPEKVLKEETKNQKYGEWTQATALTFEGYKHVGEIVNKKIGDDPITIYVYYEPDETQKATVTYTVENGTVTNESDAIVKANASGLTGSTAAAAAGYKFDGWYKGNEFITNELTLTPETAKPYLNKNGDLYAATTFTAKFEPKADLSYTVNYYWNGTTEKVAEPTTVYGQTFGAEGKASPATIDGCTITPESDKEKSITIGADSTKNVINFYYYKNVTLTANSDTKTYNGQEQSVSGFTGAPEGADFRVITVGASGTDVGTYDATFPDGTKGKVDATGKYIVTAANPGTLTISKREVTLTSASDSKTYDGTALTKPKVTVSGDGFVKGEVSDIEATGSVTNVSDSPVVNTITFKTGANFKASNYNIQKTEGTLTINKRPVTLTSEGGSKPYDGTALTKPVVTVSTGENEGFVDGEVSEIKATGSVTYVSEGEVTNAITFTLNDGKLESNYDITKNEGKLSITETTAEVVVTITGHNNTVTYNGSEQSITGYDVDINNKLYKESDFKFSGNAEAKGTDADKYDMGLNKSQFTNNNGNFTNVTFVVTDGQLIINRRSVTLTSEGGSKPYDGNALTKPKVTVSGDGFVDGEVSNIKATGSVTNVSEGEVTNTITFTPNKETFKEDNYNITRNQGTLSINKRSVTLISATASKTYDGTALTKSDVTIEGSFVKGEVTDIRATGSVTHVSEGEVTNTIDFKTGKNFDANNYTITKHEGKLSITPIMDEVLVEVTGNTANVTYDGKLHSVEGYAVDSISNSLYKASDFTYNGDAKAEGTDAATYPMNLAETRFENTNTNFKNVRFEVVEDGQLVINPRPVVLTSADLTKVYDGTALTNGDTPVTEMFGTEDAFPKGEGVKYTFTGSQMNVGKSENTFTYVPKEGTKEDNYTFEVKFGTLEVTPVTDKVTVTIKGGKSSVTYNGEEHTVSGYKVADISNPLYKEANFTFSGTAEAKGKNAGTYKMGLKAADFANTSNNFTNVEFVVADGQLEITKRPVMLTSADLIKVYDGTPLKNGDTPVKEEFGTEKAFPKGEGVTYTFKGSQTNAGSSKNMFTYAWNEGTNKDNYTIYQVEGDLVVTPIDGIKVTITGHKDTQTYDGKEHSVFGFDATPSNTLYNPKEDMQFNGTGVDMTAKGTDAGQYDIGLTAEHFTNKSNNFTNVTFVVTDGYVKITPRAVTLTSETAGKTYDGTALEKPVVTVGGDGFVEGQVKEIKATGSVTNAGSVANTITFTPDKETFKDGNYAITKNEGTLTVAKRSVLLTSQSATKTYDGSALTRPAVTITGDGFVPGELAKAEATGSITNVGSTPNAIQYTTTGAFNPANYSIALSVGTLTVTAKPEPEPRRTFNLTISYVYQNGKRAAASYNRGGLKNGETFDITSPVIAGYTASETVVSGTIYNRDIKVTVIYTADGVNLDDYGVPLGLGNITMNVGDCFE